MEAVPTGGVYLRAHLAPFEPWLARDTITEILVNRPGEVWIEESGVPGMTAVAAPHIDNRLIERLAQQIARETHQGINRQSPVLAAALPDGARVQIIAPPATTRHWALAIRRHRHLDVPLSAYDDGPLVASGTADWRRDDPHVDPVGFLRRAVAQQATILISGGTSSGKTTLLGALLNEVPEDERVILVEDTPEIRLRHANGLGLVAVKGEMGKPGWIPMICCRLRCACGPTVSSWANCAAMRR
jgi:type IV secretion system protein VirB11